jgi:hypothetical protein
MYLHVCTIIYVCMHAQFYISTRKYIFYIRKHTRRILAHAHLHRMYTNTEACTHADIFKYMYLRIHTTVIDPRPLHLAAFR